MRAYLLRMAAIMAWAFIFATHATAASLKWHDLSPYQKEILTPLAEKWNQLPLDSQVTALEITALSSSMTDEQKERLKQRLPRWLEMRPEEREQAKRNYQLIKETQQKDRQFLMQRSRQRDGQRRNAPP